MKKLLRIVVLGLLTCNISFAECIEGSCENGKGTYIDTDGSKYVGEFKNGKFHGQGSYYSLDGGKYFGEYKNNEKDGLGTLITPFSCIGIEIVNNKGHTEVVNLLDYMRAFPTKSIPLPNFEDFKSYDFFPTTRREGGKFLEFPKNLYVNHVFKIDCNSDEKISKIRKKGKESGIFSVFEDDKYVGKFVNGKRHGYGIYTTGDTSYEGEWKEDMKHGMGILINRDKTMKFIGNFINNQQNGEGTLISIEPEFTVQGNFDKFHLIGEGQILVDGKSHKVILTDGKYTWKE